MPTYKEMIKALKTQSCNACWMDYENVLACQEEECVFRKAIQEAIKLMEEKQGKWILTENKDELYTHIVICSNCNEENIGDFPYCPHCGAKMINYER